jgi:hypothetical protein
MPPRHRRRVDLEDGHVHSQTHARLARHPGRHLEVQGTSAGRITSGDVALLTRPSVSRACTVTRTSSTPRRLEENGSCTFVGVDEVDLERACISWRSPLAGALMNAGQGASVVLRAPGGTEHLEVLEVRYERIPCEPFREPPGSENPFASRLLTMCRPWTARCRRAAVGLLGGFA